jgi:hypothetical protein
MKFSLSSTSTLLTLKSDSYKKILQVLTCFTSILPTIQCTKKSRRKRRRRRIFLPEFIYSQCVESLKVIEQETARHKNYLNALNNRNSRIIPSQEWLTWRVLCNFFLRLWVLYEIMFSPVSETRHDLFCLFSFFYIWHEL